MPSKVGHVTAFYEDGTMRVRDNLSNEEHFGQMVVGSGGMLMFSKSDERGVTVGAHIISPDDVTKGLVGPEGGPREPEEPLPQRVTVGKKKDEG